MEGFPRQKAVYPDGCLAALSNLDESGMDDPRERGTPCNAWYRLKIASWIVRNVRKSESANQLPFLTPTAYVPEG